MSEDDPTTDVDLQDRLEKLVARNVAIEEDLIKRQVRPNPYIILSMRLDLVLEQLFPMTEERLAFEIESARRVHDILMHIQQQVLEEQSKPKLLLPEPNIGPVKGGFIPN